MSAQLLGEKARRRVERQVGEPVVRAWSHGSYTFDFVTAQHRHGVVNKVSGQVQWLPPLRVGAHYTSCRDLFPRDFDPLVCPYDQELVRPSSRESEAL